MPYRLTPLAEADLEAITDFIAAENPRAALRLVELFSARWELLALQPRSGAPCDDLAAGLRRVVIGNYLTFYRLEGEDVAILRVLHGSRDIGSDEVSG